MYSYCLAGCCIVSTIEFPELPAVDQSADLELTLKVVPAPAAVDLSFEFDLEHATVFAAASAEVDAAEIRETFLGDIFPMCMSAMGCPMLHASCVVLPNGRAVAFVGKSGSGKSTIAAYLHAQGATVLADDFIRVQTHDSGLSVYPSITTLRLTEQSVLVAAADLVELPRAELAPQKRRFVPALHGLPDLEPLPLAAIFAVSLKPEGTPLSAERRTGHKAFVELLQSSFILDPNRPADGANQFEVLREVYKLVPVVDLAIPRGFASLHLVQAEVERAVDSLRPDV